MIKLFQLVVLFVLCLGLAAQAQTQDILQAVQQNNLDTVKALLKENPEAVSSGDPFGRKPIHFAANAGNLEMVNYLLSQGADPKTLTNAGTSSLHYAALNGNVDIIKLFLEKGIELDIQNNQSATPFYYAAMQGHAEAVTYLLDQGAAIDTKDQTGRTALHFIAMSGNVDLATKLIQKGLNPELVDLYQKTPLYYAAENGHQELVDFLILKTSPGIWKTAADGSTLLHAVAAGGLQMLAGFLLEKKADINSANRFGETPLTLAMAKDHKELAAFLKERGGKSGQTDPSKFDDIYLDPDVPGKQPVLFAPGFISTSQNNERDIAFSADHTEIYFTRWLGGDWDIMVIQKEGANWNLPEKTSFSSPQMEAEAYFTPDEQRLFFISNRPATEDGPAQDWEIWYIKRAAGDWSPAALLGGPFKGGFYTTFTRNGTMYLTLDGNLCKATAQGDGFEDPVTLPEAVNASGGYNSFVAPDESYLIFSTQREGDGFGDGDLYISFRNPDDTWTEALNMGPTVNSFARDYCPSISPDGKYFFFASRRLGNESIFWMEAGIIEKLKSIAKQ
jgi:ankyrin repeat protein